MFYKNIISAIIKAFADETSHERCTIFFLPIGYFPGLVSFVWHG